MINLDNYILKAEFPFKANASILTLDIQRQHYAVDNFAGCHMEVLWWKLMMTLSLYSTKFVMVGFSMVLDTDLQF